MIEAVLDELKPPRDLPLVDAIRADLLGNLWVRTYDNLTTASATWLVLTSTGKPLAVGVMPRALDIREIGSDYVLGILPDADGVQHVVVYDLSRS
jgi:hypothetical protein